jgi:iron complex outermembrane receptor protein
VKSLISAALAGASVLVLASTASAQTATAVSAAAPAEEATLGEIVVTARRKSESLQSVPQTVNAISSDTLQKLNITTFTDVQNVVPGLSLQNSGNGYTSSASMRGITFDVNTAAPLGTVTTYMNDAAVQTSFMFNSQFDLGQVEVLKGPQGTTRGVSSPSGAITVTTRRPDLSQFGGYANVTLTDQAGRNFQGALNIPVIQDVLALRVAGLVDQTRADGVTSINNNTRPSLKTTAERFSLSFEPNDRLNANIMYQHLDRRAFTFDQVSGPGHTGPDGFVSPPISPFDRVAVEDGVADARTHQDLLTAQVDSRIFGQHLSYVGSYQHTKTHARNMGVSNNADVGNIIPGVETYNFQDVGSEYTTQEIRVSSDPAPGRFWDYTVGAYYSWGHPFGVYTPGGDPMTPGAFGPTGLDLSQYNPAYTAFHVTANIPQDQQETSLFGNVTFHLGDNTELSGGIRHIWSLVKNKSSTNFANGLVNLGGTNIVLTPGMLGLPTTMSTATRFEENPNIYNVSLSHRFTRDILAYANTGTSFRPGFFSPGIQGDILTSTNPVVQTLSNHPAERSRSYEVGVKTTFLDGRARFNADIYRQRFSNFSVYIPNINYMSNRGVANFPFTQSVDAKVQGFEIDTAFQVTRDWNIGLLYSYADGKIQGSQVPCNTFDAAGAPTFNTDGLISMCQGGSASRLPFWNASLSSDYTRPVNDQMDGFARMLFSYFPENKNRMEPGFTVPSYGLLNLYAGVRSHDGAWEVSVFAKNALQNKTVLDKSPVAAFLSANTLGSYVNDFPTTSGYFATQITPPREVGINVRYAFGSR